MRWDLYCRVVDNFGDVGVAWRLAADLAGRGESVRLAIDDASALAWMAPRGAVGVDVVGWADGPSRAPDVVVELFGAGRPPTAAPANAPEPLFVNLEHLSAESYVERSHGLPSPAARVGEPPSTTWFFFPGFSEATGGLLREPGLVERRRAFGLGDDWLAALGVPPRAGERRVSLFSYGNDAIGDLLDALATAPTLLLLAPGAASEQAAATLGPSLRRGALRAVRLPLLAQTDFDRLLWSCQLNVVRGEDSFVRAFWAGAPFLWQAYVQDDGAHAAKVDAFLTRFLAGAPPALDAALRALFGRWNGTGRGALAPPLREPTLHAAWLAQCVRWRDGLAAQDDLVTRLLRFVEAKR
ncbi:MAG TPA: elongation factor P maturation arginine rhamnosyltransferase EarP [Caldimonas sp.]|nr:elongation factor P maturation arginine rhamnosyltransferase EarP [Caldimonas sp.]